MADCVALARTVAAEAACRHQLPIFLYEEAATSPARRNLEDIRRGEFEGLAAKMAQPEWRPDFGPAAPHPSAGASVIGARMPLIAYNINLKTRELRIAKAIASAVRQSSGGLRHVRAMGVDLADRGMVQVSMNLTNYEKTPIFRVFELVKREAERHGVAIANSEIIGLVPAAALTASAAWFLQLDARSARTRFWRTRLRRRGASKDPGVISLFARLFLVLLPRRNPEAAHLSIEVAALDAERIGGARDVAVEDRERAQDVLALPGIARRVERLNVCSPRGLRNHDHHVEKRQVGGDHDRRRAP